MELNLRGLENLVESTSKALEMAQNSEEVVLESVNFDNGEKLIEKYGKIVKGVAKKYASKWVSREDLEQALWIKVLEVVKGCGGIENTNKNLISRCCFNLAVDFYRKSRKDYETNGSLEVELERPEGQLEYDEGKLLSNSRFANESQQVYMLVKEVIELFPEDSKERKYVEMRLYNAGLLDPDLFEEVEIPGTPKSHKNVDDKIDFMPLIGYNGKKISGGWINRENAMKDVIHKYLGI